MSPGSTRCLRGRSARAIHGRLDGDERAALPLYRRILALQPKRTEALEGREDALSDLLQRAHEHVTRGELAQAAGMVALAREYDPGHIGLPDARAALARAADGRRQQAARALRRRQLETATAGYRDALAVDPDDDAAQAGLQQVALLYAQRGERLAADFRFAEAERAIACCARAVAAASGIGAGTPRNSSSRRGRARRACICLVACRATVRSACASPPAAAAAAEARGDLLGPPG